MSRLERIVIGTLAALVVTAVVGLLVLVWLLGDLFRTYSESYHETLADWPGADEFAEGHDLTLPASARDIHLSQDGFMDPLYEIRFSADPTDLDGLVASDGCGGLVDEDRVISDVITEERSWWQPEEAADSGRTRWCAVEELDGRVQRILLDQTDPGATLVYVMIYYF